MSSVVRIRYRGTRVTVNTAAIQGEFKVGGKISRHAHSVGRNIKREAEAMAPIRGGELKRSHTGPHYSTTWLGGHVTVGNDAPHAMFVHKGTTGPILPRNHTGYLWIRPAPHSWYAPNYTPFDDFEWGGFAVNAGGRTPRRKVRGQRANPWLADAMRMVVRITYL